jgi:hypothetical protein
MGSIGTFLFDGMTAEMQPAITKWGFEDLGDEPDKHRWRAWWADDGTGGVCGIELRAYPVIKVNPASVWINEDGCRKATKQPWEDGAPAMEWVPFNPARMKKRICHNGASASWAKPTQDEAIRSLAIRLCRWTARLHTGMKRAESAAAVLEKLRPEWSAFSQTARAHLKGNIDWRNPE